MKLVGIVVALCLIGCISFWKLFPQKQEVEYIWVEVSHKGISPTLTEVGVIEPSNVSLVQTFTSGTILELKKNGEMVHKGDVVGRIDTSNYDDDIAEIEIELETANLKLAIDYKRIDIIKEIDGNKTAIKRKTLEYSLQNRDYEFSLPDKRELRKLEISLELTQLDLEEAEANLKRQQNLYKKGFLSKASLETYERRFHTTKEKLKEAELNISISKKGITQERRVELEQQVLRSKLSVERSEKRLERRIIEYKDIVLVTKQKIEELNFRRSNIMGKLNKSTCFAQQDGFVRINIYRDYRSGGQYSTYASGVEVYERDVIAYVVDPSKMKVDVIFNESDAHSLKAGQKVTVSLPAFPEQNFPGTLISIGAIGKDRNLWLKELTGKSGVSMYNGVVEFESEEMLHPGMSAVVKVSLESPRNGLVIPRNSIIFENDKLYAFSESGKQELTGNFINELEFEVTSGLKKSDKVRLSTQVAE